MSDTRPVQVRTTNLDRVLWPETGFTKRQMLAYYEQVAEWLVPHVRGRPMTLGRFPEGVHAKGWYQTNCRGAPSWLPVAQVPAADGSGRMFRMCLVNDVESLLWVANQGTVELHPYLSTAGALDEPVALVVDLDPGEGTNIVDCCRSALAVRERLAADGLDAAVKTTGSAGLHLFVGLAPGATFEATRSYARQLAATMAADGREALTDSFRHADRVGKVLFDWRQNEKSRSMIAPYSLRATPWPLVSLPLDWSEVEATASSGDARRLFIAPADAVDHVTRRGDLFASVLERSNRLLIRELR